jgi:methylenetetrahydrofolate dehydrogenase (NADP+) / methenyltetrahydrofolate cyclohydrolase
MKILNGADISAFIKERQARQVRALIQAHDVKPRLAIIQTKDDPVINTYVRLKKEYGKDILVDVAALTVKQEEILGIIKSYNDDPLTHGIIIQLPLSDISQTEMILRAVSPQKDVDELSGESQFSGATAVAINWLLAGYNVDLKNKKIVIIGNGRLVGQPLYRLWQASGYDVIVLDSKTKDLAPELKQADIIVSATGVPGLLTSEMIPIGAVVVDAGTASEGGKTIGDVADDVHKRHDLTITPKKGGVGPLTVAALFDNVIRAATKK